MICFCYVLRQQLFILYTNMTLDCVGFEMSTVGTAIFPGLYFDYINNYKLVPVATNSSVSSEAQN